MPKSTSVTVIAAVIQPGPTNLTVGSDLVFVPASPTPQLNSVHLAWDRSPDATVTGYALYFQPTNSVMQRANVGNVTNVTLGGLTVGVAYHLYCVSYDSLGTESVPSNQLLFTVPAKTDLYVDRWRVVSYGAFGRTNVLQMTTNLTAFTEVARWVGTTNRFDYLHTNQFAAWFRVVQIP